MSAGNLLFAVCSILCVAGALITVGARNPVRAAMGLLATIVGIAGLFLKLDAQFLAAIQLIVYAGAVVVLFVFVLMLLGPAAARAPAGAGKARISRILGGVLAGLLAFVFLLLVAGSSSDEPTRFGKAAPDHGSVEAVGRLLFSDGIVVFELATALLIVAVVGAIAVARGKQGIRRPRKLVHSPKEMFRGPLHPRDAERPLSSSSAINEGPAE